MPGTWSKKKKFEMLSRPHQQKPDVDNLAKAILDALLKDDSGVHTLFLTKVWSEDGFIEITHL